MENILVSACLLGVSCRYDGNEKAHEEVLALLNRNDIHLIPICPEQWGGMQTPRHPSERIDDKVMNCIGEDVTAYFEKGANEALKVAKLYHCKYAILKERSPSCGKGVIYDGTFSGSFKEGDGMTAQLLTENGIRIFGESKIDKLCEELEKKENA